MKHLVVKLLALVPVLALGGCVTRTVVYEPAPPPPGAQEVVVDQAPPPPIQETYYAAPGPDFIWIGGFWAWHGHWAWNHGYWGRPPHHGAVYVGPSYRPHPSGHGYIYIGGHWR